MKKSTFFAVLFTILYAFPLFAQLDSVYYQGPYSGSVSGGNTQTTDNFSDSYDVPPGEPRIIPRANTQDFDVDEFNIQMNSTQTTKSIYVEDGSTSDNPSENGGQTVLLNSFQGQTMTNFIPPDPTVAVGPNHIITCANSLFKIFDKGGNLLKTISAGAWWSPVWPEESGDPQVIYDHYAERWVLVWMQVNQNTLAYGDLIAYSDDSDPLGTWYMYRLPLQYWGDYPHIGYDEEALYIMTRQVSASSGYRWNQIRIINKAELYSSNTGPLTYKDIRNIRVPGLGASSPALDCIHPAISYTPGSGGWFFWARGNLGGGTAMSSYYAMYKITNPLTTITFRGKKLDVSAYFTPPNANQLDGGNRLETIGWIS
jgi:hypothetical protein